MFWVIFIGIILFWINRGFHGAIWSGKLSSTVMFLGTFVQAIVLIIYLKWSWPKAKALDEKNKT